MSALEQDLDMQFAVYAKKLKDLERDNELLRQDNDRLREIIKKQADDDEEVF